MEIADRVHSCDAEERRRLADAVRHHQINLGRMPAQPEGKRLHIVLCLFMYANVMVVLSQEVIETLRASMRAQVASLAEDNWMYEAEELLRAQ